MHSQKQTGNVHQTVLSAKISRSLFALFRLESMNCKFIKKKSNKMQHCIKMFILSYLYEAQHVSGDTSPIIRSLKLHWQRPPSARPITPHVWKARGCQCSFRLLMMGGVSPETCWASYRYGIINNFYTLLHLVRFFFMNCTMMHGSTNINIVDDFDLCCHNVYWIMASRTVLRAAATLLINSNKVRLYN